MTDTEREVISYLEQRADSYGRDARAFQDAGRLGNPIMSPGQDEAFSLVYRIISGELRLVAARLASGDGLPRVAMADVAEAMDYGAMHRESQRVPEKFAVA